MAELRDLQIDHRRSVPSRHLRARYSRSGGPGGQNVNKVATKVDLRLDLSAVGENEGFSEKDLARIREKLAARLDSSGCLQVASSEHRTQAKNLDAALHRMESLLRAALRRERPRRPTKPSRASKERRLNEKQKRGMLKRTRRSKPSDED